MEIYKNGSWQKLCTRSWDTGDENLTCQAMGYTNNVGYDNGMCLKDSSNKSSRSIHLNCTTLIECESNIEGNTQLLCKGNQLMYDLALLNFVLHVLSLTWYELRLPYLP